MLMILLELLGALAVAVFIVWWTMFSGRHRGELRRPAAPTQPPGDEPHPPR